MAEINYNQLTDSIIGCAYKVSNKLGCGFLEKVYENAMIVELKKINLEVKQQHPIKVNYENVCVGEYFADLLINDEVIVELKAVKNIDEIHSAQLLNYLKATNKKIGLIINFAKPKVEIKRLVNNF